MKKILDNKILIGSFILFTVSMGANVINYLFHLIIGRLLGPVDYGILASLFSILYLLSIVPSSSSFAIVKYISSTKSDDETAYVFFRIKNYVRKISIVLAIVLLVISPLIANFLHIGNIFNVLLLVPILYFVINTISYQATLQGLLLFWAQSLPILFSSFGKFVLSIIFVIVGLKVFGAMFGILFSALFAYYFAVFITNRKINLNKINFNKFDFDVKDFNKYGFNVFINALAFTSIFTTDVILAKHFLSELDAGIYASLSTLGKIIFFAAQPLTAVMFPIVSKKRSSGENYQIVFLSALFLTILVALGVLSIYWIFPKVTIRLLFGREYLMAAGALVYMGIFDALYSVCYYISNYLLSVGRTSIVWIPSLAAILQIILISFFHSSVLEIINISIYLMLFVFFVVTFYLIKLEFYEKYK